MQANNKMTSALPQARNYLGKGLSTSTFNSFVSNSAFINHLIVATLMLFYSLNIFGKFQPANENKHMKLSHASAHREMSTGNT